MNEEENQGKFLSGFYDKIEDSAVGKFLDLSGEKKAAVDQAKREGKFGKASQGLQGVVDILEKSLGIAMTPVTKTVETVSDVTNVDERAVGNFVTAMLYGRGLVKKVPKIKTPERFKPVNQRTVNVKAETVGTEPTTSTSNIVPSQFINSLKKRIGKPNIVKQGEEIFSGRLFGITGGNFPSEDKPLSDDALTERYYEINNPDSYVTDIADPNYGKLKSEVTFTPQGQLDLDIQTPDPLTVRSMMKRAIDNNLTTNNRLDFVKLLQSKTFQSAYRRFIASDIATAPSKGLPMSKRTRRTIYQTRTVAFYNYRKELLEEFKSIYGNDISALGFPEKQLDLDHRLTLVQSLGMLHNTSPADPLWRRITKYALERGYTPGDAEANLDLIDPESHRVKTNFFNDLHGLNEGNLKYWNGLHRNTGKTRLQIMSESHLSDEAADLHMEVVKDYFDVVDRGDKILQDALRIFKAENKLGILPEEIVDELMPVILNETYSPVQVQDAIRDIVTRNTQNYKDLKKRIDLLEFIEDYENFPDSTLSASEYADIDPADVADAKKEYTRLGRVTDRKSYIERILDRRARLKQKEIDSGFVQEELDL